MTNVEREWSIALFTEVLETTVKAKTEREAIEKAQNLSLGSYRIYDPESVRFYATPMETF